MSTQPTSTHSLHVIDHLPIDYSNDIFTHYPRLKLGVTDSVNYFGAPLLRLAEDVIAQSVPARTDWAITGPAYNVLQGAPNLLCSYIWERLNNTLPDSIKLSLVHLRVPTDNLEITDSESLGNYHNYSTLTHQDRTTHYERSPEPVFDLDDFRGRSILFINDIKVTGTHQRYMQQAFEKVAPQQICWLYILVIDQEIAEAQPEIEFEINHSCVAGFEEFAELLATQDLEYTARCITRLLSYESSQLAKLFHLLDVDRKKAILELALAEGRFNGEFFREKVDLLKQSTGMNRESDQV